MGYGLTALLETKARIRWSFGRCAPSTKLVPGAHAKRMGWIKRLRRDHVRPTCLSGWWFQRFLFSARSLGKWSNLTNIFQMGWFNHQLVILALYLWNEQQPTVEPVKMLDLHRDFFPKSRCLGDKLSLFQFVSSVSKKMSFPVCPALI